ncbi:hypothetical protein MAJHIDBO_02243 [Propionibacterium freudenreichii subsp. shermanii]|nr:hypothetical protein MAJHIDBO_02243 [Propionibacterium freudenreichii subsp. shermanii]SPS10024.1 hypothetical protein MAJHIDBO_02243 [Propionibacterium freudenreichii subsp. shermanii]
MSTPMSPYPSRQRSMAGQASPSIGAKRTSEADRALTRADSPMSRSGFTSVTSSRPSSVTTATSSGRGRHMRPSSPTKVTARKARPRRGTDVRADARKRRMR